VPDVPPHRVPLLPVPVAFPPHQPQQGRTWFPDYLGVIPVIFQGGKGLAATKKIDVKLTRVDGSVQTATVGTRKGDEVELQGTRGSGSERGWADRVEVWVTMNTGQTYKIIDVLREYRSRG
jgi:hypothetical protein